MNKEVIKNKSKNEVFLHHGKFIWDVAVFTFSAFGGPQVHVAVMLRDFVKKRGYLSEKELLELNALTQILPGPSSTQTLIGLAWKVGGLPIALLTFLIWILPSTIILCLFAIFYSQFKDLTFTKRVLTGVQPVALGMVAYSIYLFTKNTLNDKISYLSAFFAAIVAFFIRNAYAFPLLLLVGGLLSSLLYPKIDNTNQQVKKQLFVNVNKTKLFYFIGILLLFALLGAIINKASPFSLPIRLFENFYRNGILVFGGGQVLISLMLTEFVEVKHYLLESEFLTGFALQQILPGPTFSFASFVGAMTMINQGRGILGQIAGSFIAVLGINLPGLILILFIVPFWNDLRKIVQIKSFLRGINAVAVGFMFATLGLLWQGLDIHWQSMLIVILTFLLLLFTRVHASILIVLGIGLGFIL